MRMEENSNPPVRRSPWHIYPQNWQPSQWLVPYAGENAAIFHGHTDPEDHSLCGPVLCCCANSQELYLRTFPESAEAQASWELTQAEHILTWLEGGVNVLYFIFCDPVRPEGLLAGGLSGEEARQVVMKVIPIEQFAHKATRLR
jgi:hypothetical protein